MIKKKTSHNLTLEALRLLKALAQKYGVSQTAVLEIIIRDKAKSEGLTNDSAGSGTTETQGTI
jgi:hypothetical protein